MKPFEIELDGKIYKIDFSKFTTESKERLIKLTRQFKENKDYDAIYEALEIMTGIEREELNELDELIIAEIAVFLIGKLDKIIRLQSH